MITLSVATNFSRTPGPRTTDEGPSSGESFRTLHLAKAVRRAQEEAIELLVDLDGTAGYSTGFLEEAFGGLVRHNGFSAAELRSILRIKSDEEPFLAEDVFAYIADAERHRGG